MLVSRQFLVAIDFHNMEENKLWKSMGTVNCLLTNIIVFNTKEDIFKNVGKQTVSGSHWPP